MTRLRLKSDRPPACEFHKCVDYYRGDAHYGGFSCRDQYLAMVFAQLTYRESLPDIEACLGSMRGKLYRLGFRGRVTKARIADYSWHCNRHTFASRLVRAGATSARLPS